MNLRRDLLSHALDNRQQRQHALVVLIAVLLKLLDLSAESNQDQSALSLAALTVRAGPAVNQLTGTALNKKKDASKAN